MRRRGSLALALATAAIAALAGSAQAAVTIGSNLGNAPDNNDACNAVPCTETNLALSSDLAANGLASPVNGTITSWKFSDEFVGNTVSLRVLRPGAGVSYTGAGTSASVTSLAYPQISGPFPTSLPIHVGDHVGLDGSIGSGLVSTLGNGTMLYWTLPPLADGSTRDGTVTALREVLVQATVDPANTVTFGAVTLNKKKGTATVPMTVPNAGQLSYSGTGLNVAGPANVAAPGDVSLSVNATGKKRKKLNQKGKVGTSFAVTFTPTNGTAGSSTETLTLRKKLKR